MSPISSSRNKEQELAIYVSEGQLPILTIGSHLLLTQKSSSPSPSTAPKPPTPCNKHPSTAQESQLEKAQSNPRGSTQLRCYGQLTFLNYSFFYKDFGFLFYVCVCMFCLYVFILPPG